MKKAQVFLTCIFIAIWANVISFRGSAVVVASPGEESTRHAVDDRELFVHRAAEIWGKENVWESSPTSWIQYESDLGERSAVDFENGTVRVQLLIDSKEDAFGEKVLDHLRQGVRNLVLGDAVDPVEMVILKEQKKKAVKSSVKVKKLYSSHDLTLGYVKVASTRNSLIIDQIRRRDGRTISYEEVGQFAEEVVDIRTVKKKIIVGADGIRRQAVTVEFNLAPNHLEIRARKVYPWVKASAGKYQLDPSLIMGIIHTESMFNPRARSRTPAFGLMQLVPKTGAREAHAKLFGSWKTPSSEYLYDPKNNIELGVAYFDILKTRYMKLIDDPVSQTYCAVAAYNAGASNVGRAFVPHKSIKKASPVINTLQPHEVYDRLVDTFHIKETRLYTQRVLTRSVAYYDWE
jgi:membrane-bound lytic murein transglycosylase C